MPFDLIGYAELTPGTGLVNIAAGLGEDLYEFQGDNIRLKERQRFLIGAFCAACSTGEDYHLRQPDFKVDRQFLKIQLGNDLDPSQGHSHLFGRPMPLKKGKWLEALIQNATDEGALEVLGLITDQDLMKGLVFMAKTGREFLNTVVGKLGGTKKEKAELGIEDIEVPNI